MDKINDLLKEYQQYITVEDLDSLKVLRGFIKWLVDNDKIELHELSKKELATWWSLENNILDEENTKESWIKFWTENLLMLLAIQDSPLEFLCSIIK